MLFVLSSAFHLGVWVTAGMPSLEGPVSWRKPMTFGISTGVLSVSLAWVIGLLPQTARRVRQAWFFSLLLIAEVALAMRHRLPISAISDTIHSYPTMSEGVFWTAYQIVNEKLADSVAIASR